MNNENKFTNTCNMKEVTPIMVALPHPPIQVQGKNQAYANLLSIDYCGAVSEMSAITQYINNQNRLSYHKCPLAKTILGISMAEMIHLNKLGELIFLLGGNVDFIARHRNGKQIMWTPQYLKLSDNPREILQINIEGEKEAINQYEMHIRMIEDDYIRAVLARIVKDEYYHISLLKTLLAEL